MIGFTGSLLTRCTVVCHNGSRRQRERRQDPGAAAGFRSVRPSRRPISSCIVGGRRRADRHRPHRRRARRTEYSGSVTVPLRTTVCMPLADAVVDGRHGKRCGGLHRPGSSHRPGSVTRPPLASRRERTVSGLVGIAVAGDGHRVGRWAPPIRLVDRGRRQPRRSAFSGSGRIRSLAPTRSTKLLVRYGRWRSRRSRSRR